MGMLLFLILMCFLKYMQARVYDIYLSASQGLFLCKKNNQMKLMTSLMDLIFFVSTARLYQDSTLLYMLYIISRKSKDTVISCVYHSFIG